MIIFIYNKIIIKCFRNNNQLFTIKKRTLRNYEFKHFGNHTTKFGNV